MADLRARELLRRLADEAGASSLVSSYPDGYLNILLRKGGDPQVALQKLLDSDAALSELRRMEAEVDTDRLFECLKRGHQVVRGWDIHGRPVVWTRHWGVRNLSRLDLDAAILGFFWVLCFAKRMQRHGEEGIVVVSSQFGTSFLDFNLSLTSEIGRLLTKLFPVTKGALYLFVPNKAVAVVANATFGILRRGENLMTTIVSDQREEIFSILEDPSNYPAIFMEGGRSFETSFDEIGNWRDLVYRRQGFATMTFGDLHTPCPESLALIRDKALKEETATRETASARSQSSSSARTTPTSSEDSQASPLENASEFFM